MNNRHIEIIRIYKLSQETKLNISEISILFPKFTYNDIEKIKNKEMYTHITSKVDLDTDYINQIFRTEEKSIFPLGETYIKEIYKFAKSEIISMNLLSTIFGISYETIKRIKNQTTKRYVHYTRDIEIIKADSKRCKIVVELTDDEKLEVIKMNTMISNGEITLRKVARTFNVDLSTIKHIYEAYGIELNTKFDPKKLTDKDIINIFIKSNTCQCTRAQLAEKYGVSARTIGSIKNGQSHVSVLRFNGLIP